MLYYYPRIYIQILYDASAEISICFPLQTFLYLYILLMIRSVIRALNLWREYSESRLQALLTTALLTESYFIINHIAYTVSYCTFIHSK